MKLSAGARKELMVMQFAYSVIHVSMQEGLDTELIKRENNKNYHINKRIDRRLKALEKKLSDSIVELLQEGGHETASWIRKNLDKRVSSFIVELQEKGVNLESLGIWVLFVNFCERKEPLHVKMKWLQDEKQYLEMGDMMSKTEASAVEGEMFKEAHRVIERIKG